MSQKKTEEDPKNLIGAAGNNNRGCCLNDKVCGIEEVIATVLLRVGTGLIERP